MTTAMRSEERTGLVPIDVQAFAFEKARVAELILSNGAAIDI
jgi:hypothetical protein